MLILSHLLEIMLKIRLKVMRHVMLKLMLIFVNLSPHAERSADDGTRSAALDGRIFIFQFGERGSGGEGWHRIGRPAKGRLIFG